MANEETKPSDAAPKEEEPAESLRERLERMEREGKGKISRERGGGSVYVGTGESGLPGGIPRPKPKK